MGPKIISCLGVFWISLLFVGGLVSRFGGFKLLRGWWCPWNEFTMSGGTQDGKRNEMSYFEQVSHRRYACMHW